MLKSDALDGLFPTGFNTVSHVIIDIVYRQVAILLNSLLHSSLW